MLIDLGLIEPDQPEGQVTPRTASGFVKIDVPLSATEQKLINILDGRGKTLDTLAEEVKISVSDLMQPLLSLEFKGLVEQIPGRKFIRR